MAGRGPSRRADDHLHPEYWERLDQHRFEDKVVSELKEIREDLEKLASRILLIFGGLGLLAFVIPLLVPIVRDWLDIPVQVIP